MGKGLNQERSLVCPTARIGVGSGSTVMPLKERGLQSEEVGMGSQQGSVPPL